MMIREIYWKKGDMWHCGQKGYIDEIKRCKAFVCGLIFVIAMMTHTGFLFQGWFSAKCPLHQNLFIASAIFSRLLPWQRTKTVLLCYRYKASWRRQFSAVLWRTWITNSRDVLIIRIRVFQAIVSLFSNLIIYYELSLAVGVRLVSVVLSLT